MTVYRVCVGQDFGYNDVYETDVGCFSNQDDAQKCINLCQQMIDSGRLEFEYVCDYAYEIEDLETVMKSFEERFSSYLTQE